ncbi:MAG: hypothetical protein QHH06_10345 [Clostridiales bacterium]|jgi:hypothetical protein|nr:hypothetical protein [Eubacteriales bacterium]MDH7566865.1 hypothetical protein [Clostridiales bacterium]
MDQKYQNIYPGTENLEVVTRIVPVSTTLQVGEIVDKGAAAGEIAKSSGVVANAYGIALEAVATDASNTASIAVLVGGKFNKDKVVYPAGKTFADYDVALRNIGIFLIDSVDSEVVRS